MVNKKFCDRCNIEIELKKLLKKLSKSEQLSKASLQEGKQ